MRTHDEMPKLRATPIRSLRSLQRVERTLLELVIFGERQNADWRKDRRHLVALSRLVMTVQDQIQQRLFDERGPLCEKPMHDEPSACEDEEVHRACAAEL